MQRIDSALLANLTRKLGISTSQVYKRIGRVANERFLPRDLAALALAAELGINVARYASPDDLLVLRGPGGSPPPQGVSVRQSEPPKKFAARNATPNTKAKAAGAKPVANIVFVVHGRNQHIRQELFNFLRSVQINPLEWHQAIAKTKKGSPYVGQILDAAFKAASAVIVLLTPDDEVRLKKKFRKPGEAKTETELMGQARPNVLFEAGMAVARNEDRTILVEIGKIKAFTDVAGRHTVRLDNTVEKRKELLVKLKNAGVRADQSGIDWHTAGDFTA